MKTIKHAMVTMTILWGGLGLSSFSFAHPTEQEKALAKTRFERAKALVKEKKYVEACPLYAESYQLDPRTGTELNLADCYEHLGMYASAWMHFDDAQDKDTRDGDTKRAEFGKKRADNIRAKVPELVLVLPRDIASLEGLVVEIDGRRIESRHVTNDPPSPIPLDPGKHVIEVQAKERITRKESVELSAGRRQSLRIDALEKVPAPTPVLEPGPAKPPAAPEIKPETRDEKPPITNVEDKKPPQRPLTTANPWRTAGAVSLGVVGLANIVTSIVSFRGASENWELAVSKCDAQNPNWCPPAARQAGKPFQEKAAWLADLATVTVAIGSAALAGSVLLLVWPQRTGQQRASGLRVLPYATPTAGGVSVQGTF